MRARAEGRRRPTGAAPALGAASQRASAGMGPGDGRKRSTRAQGEEEPGAMPPGMLPCALGLCRFSPCGDLIASARGSQVYIYHLRDPFTLKRRVSCLGNVDSIEWSFDSDILLCSQRTSDRVEVFRISDPSWSCKISEGVGGLTHVCLSPSGLQVLCVSDFQLYVSVWHLSKGEEAPETLPGAKLAPVFSEDTNWMALVHRKECKDSIAIYDAATLKELIHFSVASSDLEEVAWSPNSDCMAVRDNPVSFVVLVYSTHDGSLVARYTPYLNELGARCISWSENALAIGSFDGSVHVLDSAGFRPILCGKHDADLAVRSRDTVVICQKAVGPTALCQSENNENREIEANSASISVCTEKTKRRMQTRHEDLESATSHSVSAVQWSPCGAYVVSRYEGEPNCVFVWSPSRQSSPCAVLKMPSKVVSFRWASIGTKLAVLFQGSKSVCVWEPRRSELSVTRRVHEPEGLQDPNLPIARGIRWHPKGDDVLIIGKSRAYLATTSTCGR